MEKIILSAILFIGCAAFAQAKLTLNQHVIVNELIILQEEYKEVALTDLSEVIQEAVKNLAGDTFEVKKVEFNAEKELTRVTLTNKEDKSEKVSILDKEGKEVENPS